MVMSNFSQLDLEKRLSQLKDTADAIQSLSAWCLKHKLQHRRIVNSWLKIIKRAKVQQRLPLFYLANDVIQYSKRKNLDFVPSFQTVLEGAMPLVRDEKLRPGITRILKIWEDRGIFEHTFIATLTNVVSNVGKGDTKENAEILSDFRTSDLIKQVREVEESEKETDRGLKVINDGDFHVSDTAIEELRVNIKSRSQSKLFVSELEEGIRAVEHYVSALDLEIQQRAELIEQLERSEIYYDTQRSDAKVVAVAYKNFSKRVREMKKKLDECMPELPDVSPVPSPDVNAPSPTNSDEGLELPDDVESPQKTDPRSEIDRLIGNWTSGNKSASPKLAGPNENGAAAGSLSNFLSGGDRPLSSFLAAGAGNAFPAALSSDLFPSFPAAPLERAERDLFPAPAESKAEPEPVREPEPEPTAPNPFAALFTSSSRSPADRFSALLSSSSHSPGSGGGSLSTPPPPRRPSPPLRRASPPLRRGSPRLARDSPAESGSSIPVVTGVQQGGTDSAQDTPLEDDHDYDDDYEAGASAGEPRLSDFMRLINQKLGSAPPTSDLSRPPPLAPSAVQIPGLDLTRPPPSLPDVSHPPPDVGLWGAPPPSAPPPTLPPPPPPADRSRSWEEPPADAPCSPPQYEKGGMRGWRAEATASWDWGAGPRRVTS